MNDRRYFFSVFARFLTAAFLFCLSLSVRASDASGKMDFDGDGKTDIAVYRAGQRNVYPIPPSYFYILSSRTGQMISYHWGRAYDIHAPADYDGDGRADVAIFRWIDESFNATEGHFWTDYTSTGTHNAVQVGSFGNIISRNYYDDRRAEIGYFSRYDISKDPSEPCFIRAFYIKPQGSDFPLKKDVTNQCQTTQTYVTPAVNDYNADGLSDLATFEQSPNLGIPSLFKIWHSPVAPLYTAAEIVFPFDVDYPIPGDYDGDGIGDFAGSKNINGYRLWRIRSSITTTVRELYFGFNTDYPVPGDYDGDGKTDIGVYRPSTGVWYIVRSSDSSLYGVQFGLPTDIPLTMPNSNVYY